MADLKQIQRAARAREKAEEAFRAAIREAHATGGYTLTELAAASGVTPQRVWQIVNHRR